MPRAHLALLGASTIWGLSYPATKTGLFDMGPFEFAAARMVLAAGVFLPVYLRTRHALAWREQLIAGGLGITPVLPLGSTSVSSTRALPMPV